jgi:tRNA(fMet)-specific endonuclease VapC
MSYLLDTDMFSYFVNGAQSVRQSVLKIGLAEVKISVVTQAEIWFGMQMRAVGSNKQARIHELMEAFEVLPLDSQVAAAYAQARATLQKVGKPIGPNDLWIAAHALSKNMTLVTNNSREFKRVPGLRLENWV